MRRVLLGSLAAAALFLGACGGGDGESKNASASADVSAEVDAEVDTDVAGTAAATACSSREAVSFASNYASAMSGVGDDDYQGYSKALQKAADNSPSEIRADFKVMAEAVGPFIELFVNVEGTADYMKLVQSEDFQEKAAKVGSPEVQAASQKVDAWFAEHC